MSYTSVASFNKEEGEGSERDGNSGKRNQNEILNSPEGSEINKKQKTVA
jgi:hypothetical protein